MLARLEQVPCRRAADIILADRRGCSAANAANGLARQQVTRATMKPELGFASLDHRFAVPDRGQPRFDASPKLLIDDPQIRDVLKNPVLTGIETRYATSGCWVLAIAQTVPDQPADIKLVMQDAGAAKRMSANGCVAPGTAARSRHFLLVEFGGNPAWALSRGEVRKDATNYLRLGFYDFAAAALAVFVASDLIAITQPAA